MQHKRWRLDAKSSWRLLIKIKTIYGFCTLVLRLVLAAVYVYTSFTSTRSPPVRRNQIFVNVVRYEAKMNTRYQVLVMASPYVRTPPSGLLACCHSGAGCASFCMRPSVCIRLLVFLPAAHAAGSLSEAKAWPIRWLQLLCTVYALFMLASQKSATPFRLHGDLN